MLIQQAAEIAMCDFGGPTFLIFNETIPHLIYYSHIPITIISFLIGLLIFLRDKRALPNIILFGITTCFSIWVFLDSVFWATNRSDVMMFVWSLQILFEPLVYGGMIYLMKVIIDKVDIPFKQKGIIFFLLLPVLLLVPTKYSLPGFNITDCLSVEGFIGYYDYFIEAIFLIWITSFAFKRYSEAKDTNLKKEIILLTTGAILFLLAFASGNLIGSFTGDWNVAQAGLFGMPVFIAFLAYSIVRFQTFNVRLISAQALILALAALTGSQFFFITSRANTYLNTASFLLIIVFGYFLIRSVKREIEAREKVEKLAHQIQRVNVELASANTKLKELNQQKSEFISFATHQLRSPLTAIKGNTSLILEGDMGPISKPVKEAMQTIYTSIKTQVNIVEDYLNVSRIELGTMKYNLMDLNFDKIVEDVVIEQETNFKDKGLAYSVQFDNKQSYKIKADPDKFKQVIQNTIDNSIKYTPNGSITISLYKVPDLGVIRLKIADTGVGIHPDVLSKLFQKFSRAPKASEANIHGTGLGLYIAKEIMNAHGGRIWAESEGEGKGSQFYIELPEVK